MRHGKKGWGWSRTLRPSEQRPYGAAWWSSDDVGKFGSVSIDSKEELSSEKSIDYDESSRPLHQTASQILWSTGMFSQPIPNGFYSVVPSHDDKRRKISKDKDREKQREVIHVWAKRGQATHSHSLAGRVKINEKLSCLQVIVPGYKVSPFQVMVTHGSII